MKTDEIFQEYNEHILATYTRMPAVFVKGKGSVLTDIHGKKYLDFFPGWGVSNLGHCHPKVMGAVREQIGKLIHVPNNLYNPHQAKLARELVRIAFEGKIFFCNSGTEAMEAALKFARMYGRGQKYEIITTLNAFHGRTMGALTATGQEKHQKGFGPLVPGFKHVPFNDLDAMKSAVNDRTAAIVLELVQGEGGINVADKDYVAAIRRICDEKGILLILDEVQTGMARTGEIFAFKHFCITPDVMCIAKALGGGLPIGAMIVRKELADIFKPGMHGSTFAGSPLVCKAALGVIKAIYAEKIMKNVKAQGPYLLSKLNELKSKYGIIKEVRGLGLMIGMELTVEGTPIFKECFNRALIINCTQGNVLRIMPALNVTRRQINRAIHILDGALATVAGQPQKAVL
ncbi:MAG: aspartate aminotransferase family protein [Candidatus Omnitrophica bacterium]|nr:aspartate aminotransferase family protein [Candidatus Omnitrophota bacterium]MDE2009388.1 aspartate aminotransferase family protein [Candidatus Omnitrophota bacterium]MDE2214172.1 aspartate aminotransferase family protein [Candidatus Omnitrophota bacterium]MDE2231209.1 aspartate aminotransferase family protein [Candidatus Omnitrophota bacterium]